MDRETIVLNFFHDVAAQRADALELYFAPNACVRWHNTNEQFTVGEYIRANCEYPGEWRGEVERMEQLDNLTIAVARVWLADESASFHVTSFFKFFGEKIILLDEYWGDDGTAPKWRLDKQIGTSINTTVMMETVPLAQNETLSLEAITADDCPRITEIYNSNPDFLKYHLAVNAVTNEWVRQEQEEVRRASFCSAKLIDRKAKRTIGFFDYRLGDEAYLSLFMLDDPHKGSGLGIAGYRLIEGYFAARGCRTVRIDVVYGYPTNTMGFWEYCGFVRQEVVQLEWHGKQTGAFKMVKAL